ncbi:Immunoglobulin I-set domain [Popillia japonica]|uniref:Immunoglobulin I-set domain n=1 Tax=Popillia japonica TaxID=7064 RepID=A0AAW1KIE9_POPJA
MGLKVSKCCQCPSNPTGKHVSSDSSSTSSAPVDTLGLKNDQPLETNQRCQLHTDKNGIQLVVDNVQKTDSGVYSVRAKTPSGSVSRDIELRIGTRTRFLVETKTATEEVITWYHNEVIVREGERYRFTNEDGFHCIDVTPILEQDAGKWKCTSRNRAGLSTCTCHLNVLVPKTYKVPEFVEELRALLTEHGTVALECKVIGVPTPLLRWFKDGIEIKAGDVFALTANPDDPTTLGTYTCEATNCMGKAVSSSRVHVVGKGSREGSLKPADSEVSSGPPPMFSKDLKDEIIKIGDPIVLSCQVSVPPWPKSIVWYNSEGKINDEDPEGRYKQLADGLGGYMLEIKPTEAPDQGQWKCVATGQSGAISVSSCTVNMIIPKHFRKPRFMESLKAVLTEEGLVSFECKVVGSPTPLLRWFKDGQELKPGDVYQLTGTNSLGSYCCIAKNCMGEAVSSAELTVEDIQNQLNDEERQQLLSKSQAPKFLKGLKSCEARINENFKFTIQVTITPEASLVWYRDDQPVENEAGKYLINREVLGVSNLDITPLEFMDQAEWKCIAKNDFGHSVTSCYLKLVIPKHFRKPMFLESLRAVLSEEGAVNLECKVIGVPQPVLVWYKDGMELKPGDIHRITSGEDGTCCLGTYTCEARNCMGIVASSASLLGFEDQTKTRAEQQRIELAKVPSLSTIQEERTSQLYDTPQGDVSLTINDHGEVSFSFDGKEVSVSLYETPDITEEEAIQIVEMYADQLSEHVTEQNVVELPPLRFTKETSTSGNLVMEAVLVDVSEDYFISADDEADLRTEADIEEIFSVSDEMARSLSPNGEAPRRPPRKKNDSQKSAQESFYSLSKNASIETDAADESLALDSESFGDFASAMSSERVQEEDMAFQVAAITETTSLPGDVARDSPSTPQNTHEIGSDLRVNREDGKSKKKRRRRRTSRSSQSSEESSKEFGIKESARLKAQSLELGTEIFYRDVQGEEGDGLIIDPVLNAIKMKELEAKEREVMEKLKKTLYIIEADLDKVGNELLMQVAKKSTAVAANKSIEVLQSIIQPIRDIQTFLVTLEQQEPHTSSTSIAELIAPPIFDLQKGLAVVEKCTETQGKEHTLILKTCFNILDKTGPQIQRGLKLIENMSLLEKEMLPTNAAGRTTPSKIIQEVLTTLQETQNGMDRALFVITSKKALFAKQKPPVEREVQETDILEAETDMDVLLKFAQPAFELQETLTNVKQVMVEVENVTPEMKADIKDKIQENVVDLVKQVMATEQQVIKLGESDMDHDLYSAILETVSQTINNLSNNVEMYSNMPIGTKYEEIARLELFEAPIEEVINSLSKLGKNIPTSQLLGQEDIPITPQEVVKDVFEHVSHIIHENISQTVQTFLYNIEMAQQATSDTVVLEGLRQMATLQKDLAVTVTRSAEINTEPAIMALENLSQPLDMMNNQLLDVPTSLPSDILDDMVACLSILEDSIVLNERIEEDEDLLVLFSILKARAREVKENICILIEPELLTLQPPQSPQPRNILIRQNLSEENIAEEIIEEETSVLPVPPIVEEDIAQSKYEDLRKCIANIQDMPIMSEKAESVLVEAPQEQAQAFAETVQQLEKCLAVLQEQSSIEIPAELVEEATTVIECVEKLKTSSSLFEKPLSVADISEIKTLTGPLRRLSQTLVLLENQQEERMNIFKYVEDTLNDLKTNLSSFSKEEPIPSLIQNISNTLEVVSLERSNLDITMDAVHQLGGLANLLTTINETVSQSQETDIRNIPNLKEPISRLLVDLKEIGHETGLKFITDSMKAFLADLQNASTKSVYEKISLVTEDIVQNIETLSNQAGVNLEKAPFEEMKKSFKELKETLKLVEVQKEQILSYMDLEKSLSAVSNCIEEFGQSPHEGQEVPKEKLQHYQEVVQEMRAIIPKIDAPVAQKLTATVTECEKLSQAFIEPAQVEIVNLIEPLRAVLHEIELQDLNESDKKSNIKKIARNLLPSLRQELQKISEASSTPIQIKTMEEIVQPLNAIKDYIANEEKDPKCLRNHLEKLKTVEVEQQNLLTPIITTLQEALPLLDIEIDKIIEGENQAKIQKMKTISKVTDIAQDIVKNVASIKYAEIDKSLVIKLQRTLYALQISVNDLIDYDLNAADETFINSVVHSLDSADQFIVSRTSTDTTNKPNIQDVMDSLKQVEDDFGKVDGSSTVMAMSDVIQSFTTNAAQVLSQLGKAYTQHVKTDLVEAKFAAPIEAIKQKADVLTSKEQELSVISDLKDYLLDIKQNAQIILEQPQENQLEEEEIEYLRNLEGLAENIGDTLTEERAEETDVISKIDKLAELVDMLVVESPLKGIMFCVKEACNIANKVFKVTEKDVKLEQEVQTADVSQEYKEIEDAEATKVEEVADVKEEVVEAKPASEDSETADLAKPADAKAAPIGEEIIVVEESVSTIQLEEVREFIEETITTVEERKVVEPPKGAKVAGLPPEPPKVPDEETTAVKVEDARSSDDVHLDSLKLNLDSIEAKLMQTEDKSDELLHVLQHLNDVKNLNFEELKLTQSPEECASATAELGNLLNQINAFLDADKSSVTDTVAQIQSSLQKLNEISKGEAIITSSVKLAEAIIQKDVKFDKVTKEKLQDSLKSLRHSVETIEKRQFPEEMSAAITELEKSITGLQGVLDTKLQLEAKDLTIEEHKAVAKADNTLTHINSLLQDISEEVQEQKVEVMVETAKKSIEELRLAVVAIKEESHVKEVMEPLEETVKNVVNLFERVTTITLEKQQVSSRFPLVLKDLAQLIANADKSGLDELNQNLYENIGHQLETVQNKLVALQNANLTEEEQPILGGAEKCIERFLDLIKSSTISLQNIEDSKLETFVSDLKQFEPTLENQELNPLISEIATEIKQLNINVLKLIEKPQPAGPKPIAEPLQKLQKDIENLQNSVSDLNVNSSVKTHKIALNELPRPLIALQFVVENILVGKNEKLTPEDLNFLTKITESVDEIAAIIETAEDVAKPHQLEKIQASVEDLKVILASVNLESHIKDILEPLQEISKIVEKVLEKETAVTNEFVEARAESVKHFGQSLENISKIIENRAFNISKEPQLIVLTELEKPAQGILSVIANASIGDLTSQEIKSLNDLRNSVDDVCNILKEQDSTAENIDKLLLDLKQSISHVALIKEERAEALPGADVEKSFIEAVQEQLSELNKAIEFAHIVLEKSKTVEDVSQLRDISNPLKELLKLVLTIKHQPQGELQLLSELQQPLHDLQVKLNDCVETKIVPDEIPILEVVGKEFAAIIDIAKTKKHSDLTIADFQEPLGSLQNVIITVCSRAVLSDTPKDQESVVQKILEPLDGIIKSIIRIESASADKIAILKLIGNLVSNINYLEDEFRKEGVFSNLEVFGKLGQKFEDLKASFNSKDQLHENLNEIQKIVEETLPANFDPNTPQSLQDTLTCLKKLNQEISTILSPSSDLEHIQKLGTIDRNFSELVQTVKAVEEERIQSRRDIKAIKGIKEPLLLIQKDIRALKPMVTDISIKEPLLLIQKDIRALKPMVTDISDEIKAEILTITSLEKPIEDICLVASEIEASTEIADQLDITEEFGDQLKALQEPLQKLSIAIGDFKTTLQQPQVKKMDPTPILSALSVIKESIESVTLEQSPIQSLNILCQNLQPLSSKIGDIQEVLKSELVPRRDQTVSNLFKMNLVELNEVLTGIKSSVGNLKPFDKIMITLTLELQNPIQDFISSFEEIGKVFGQENLDDISESAQEIFEEIIKNLHENIAAISACHQVALQNQFGQNELSKIKKSLENIRNTLDKSTSIPLETYFMELMHPNLVTLKKSCIQISKQLEKSSLHLSTYETLVKVIEPLDKITKQVPILKHKLEESPALSDLKNLIKIDTGIDALKKEVTSMIALPAFEIYKEIDQEHIVKIVSLKSALGKLNRVLELINNTEPDRPESKEILSILRELRLEIGIIKSINIKLFEHLQPPLESLSDILWDILKGLEKKHLHQQLHIEIIPSLNQLAENISAVPQESDYEILGKMATSLQDFKVATLNFCDQEEINVLKDFIQALQGICQPSKAISEILVHLKENRVKISHEPLIDNLNNLKEVLDKLNFADIPLEKLNQINISVQTYTTDLVTVISALTHQVKVQGLISNILESLQSLHSGTAALAANIESLPADKPLEIFRILPSIGSFQTDLSTLSAAIESQRKSLSEDALLQLNSWEDSAKTLSTTMANAINLESLELNSDLTLKSLGDFEPILDNLTKSESTIPPLLLEHLKTTREDIQTITKEVNNIIAIQNIKPVIKELSSISKELNLPPSLVNAHELIRALPHQLDSFNDSLITFEETPCQKLDGLTMCLKKFSAALQEPSKRHHVKNWMV